MKKTVAMAAAAILAAWTASAQTGAVQTNSAEINAGDKSSVRLPDLLFAANSSRVNDCARRILLEQLRSYHERDSSGTVALVGHSSPDETHPNLAAQRALNAAAVITAGTGACLSIPSAQVQLSVPGREQNGVAYVSGACRSSVGPTGPDTAMRRVEVWFVPSGGRLPASVMNNQSASTLPISSIGCPR